MKETPGKGQPAETHYRNWKTLISLYIYKFDKIKTYKKENRKEGRIVGPISSLRSQG